jgi:uncharacterized protein YprB with RNaseH-like and TPR domain
MWSIAKNFLFQRSAENIASYNGKRYDIKVVGFFNKVESIEFLKVYNQLINKACRKQRKIRGKSTSTMKSIISFMDMERKCA